jgi:hypothetical protein
MSTDYDILGAPRPPARSRTPLIIGILAFVAGLLATAWLLSSWEPARRFVFGDPRATPPPASPVPAVPQAAMAAPATSAVPAMALDPALTSALDARVGEIEARIDRVSERANAAGANAARAEGLLIAFAARRAVDRGLGLGYIEAQLRERFGAAQPQAVATVIDASRNPVTLEDLQLGLDDLAPGLTSGATADGWWPSLRRELGSVFVIRRAGKPSTEPGERLHYARRMLEAGQVDKAMVEVARLPGAGKAQNWMAAARRYVRTRQALDMIETTAVLAPRTVAVPPPLLPDPAPAG